MGSKSSAPKPDPNIGLAQKNMAAIAKEQLETAREQYYAEQPRLDKYSDLADMFVQSQVTAQRQQTELANDYQTRMQGTFYPIEDTLAFDALGYYDASPEVQAKLEQAYMSQNQNLVNQRFDDLLAQEQANYEQGLLKYKSGGQALSADDAQAEMDYINQGLDFEQSELARAQRHNKSLQKKKGKGGIGGALAKVTGASPIGKLANGLAIGPAKVISKVAGASGDNLTATLLGAAAGKDSYQSKEGRDVAKFGRSKVDTSVYTKRIAELQAKKTKTAADLDELEQLQKAYKREYSDYEINPETGISYAEEAYNKRVQGLRTQREQELGSIGSSLDTVRAYAESYKSGQEQQAGMARQDVANQFDARSQQLQRQLQSFGVDPTSGRFASAINSNNIMQAASEAAAMNQARNAAKQLGWAKRMDASSLGRGLPGSQATSAGLAMQQGQAGLNAQSSISQMYGNANSAFMSGLGQAGSSFGQLGQLGLQANAQNQAAFQSQQQGKGALAGAVLGAVGTAFGGPLGGMVGSALGGAINTRNVT